MSIAVSVLVRPCVYLRVASCCFAGVALLLTVLLASGILGAYRLAWPGILFSLAANSCVLFSLRRPGNLHGIDISGSGHIHLTVYQGLAAAAAPTAAVSVTLLPGSTLWPSWLLLRLADASGRISVLSIWSGTVAATEFRALALACRVIAARSLETA